MLNYIRCWYIKNVSIVCIDHIVYPFSHWWTLELLPPFGYCEYHCYKHLWDPAFNFLRNLPRGNIFYESYGNATFFLRNCHIMFYGSCTILYSHQWYTEALISIHPHQHLLFSGFIFQILIRSVIVGLATGRSRKTSDLERLLEQASYLWKA